MRRCRRWLASKDLHECAALSLQDSFWSGAYSRQRQSLVQHAVRFGGYGAMACSARSPLKAFLYIFPYASFA